MLISIRRITAIFFHHSPSAPDRPQSCRALLNQSPFTTTTTVQPNITTKQDPNFTLQTLKDYGFTDTQIADLARKASWISSSRSADALCLKMSYLFNDSGLDRSDLAKIITSDPRILCSSLNNSIIPSMAYLRSILRNRDDMVHALVRAPALLCRAHTTVATNIEALKGSGVPDSSIARLVALHPRTLVRSPERFREILNSVLFAKFDPSKAMFVHAIRVKSSMTDLMWEKKVGVYLSCGWSAEEAQLAFKKSPLMYTKSEELIKKVLRFLGDVLKMEAGDVLAHTKLMTLSFERTLIPRCCVLNVLMGRDLLKKHIKVPWALCITSDRFQRLYVEKYQDDVPDVLEAYNGKMQFVGFDYLR